MARVLTNELFFNGILKGYSLITCVEGNLVVEPFEKELHSTVFIPGPIAVLRGSAVDEFVLDDIEMMLDSCGSLNDKKRLDDYFKSSSLYFCSDCGEIPLLLKIGTPCQIIPIS